jgi:ParB-like chromosome segregation protein Spo0J
MTILRNRIKDHCKVRFGDLVPHELNPRIHSEAQRAVLAQFYEEVGFARSLLVYELPNGRLKLIDGHLRRNLTPDEVLDVEVLDVTDAEARALLLAIDPLAQLASTDEEELEKLRQIAEADSAACRSLHQALADRCIKPLPTRRRRSVSG